MERLRSILWVGGAEALRAEAVADTPWLDVAWARDAEDAAALPLAAFDAVLLDVDSAGAARHAIAALRRDARGQCPPILVLVGAAGSGDEAGLRAAGAAAVALRGAAGGDPRERGERLAALLARIARPTATAGPAPEPASDEKRPVAPIARSPKMREVLALAERAMPSLATVLITGETGPGKELLARAIHQGSPRRAGPFVALNCAAFPDTLLESELFGHVRGSFTGADRNKKGLFEVANGGTLFLDEVGETSPPLQAKLLRALQEREVRPVGGARARPVDVRVVAATNRALRGEVARGTYREDLYYRLAVFHLAVPPLRERREDVLPLAAHFLRVHGERDGKRGCQLAREASDLLLLHSWPGNVRELENEMQRALAIAEPGESIAVRHLSDRMQEALRPVRETAVAPAQGGEPLRRTLARIEGWLIRRALEEHGGRRAATARALGITREGLYKKMRRFGIS